MKKAIAITMVFALGIVVGCMGLTDVDATGRQSKKGPAAEVCPQDMDCVTCIAAPGFAAKFMAMLDCLEEYLHALVENIVFQIIDDEIDTYIAKYLEQHPVEGSGCGSDSIATFPAVFPAGNPQELAGLWAPLDGIVLDTKVDLWMATVVHEDGQDRILYTPLFEGSN